jgi:hypothetical protein
LIVGERSKKIKKKKNCSHRKNKMPYDILNADRARDSWVFDICKPRITKAKINIKTHFSNQECQTQK